MTGEVQIYRSITSGNTPASLLYGEIAINIPDNRMWIGNELGVSVEIILGGGDFLPLEGSLPMTGDLQLSKIKHPDNVSGTPNINMWATGVEFYSSAGGPPVLSMGSFDYPTDWLVRANLYMDGSNRVSDMANPIDPQDAATKAYVDTGDAAVMKEVSLLQAEITDLKANLASALQGIADLQAQVTSSDPGNSHNHSHNH